MHLSLLLLLGCPGDDGPNPYADDDSSGVYDSGDAGAAGPPPEGEGLVWAWRALGRAVDEARARFADGR